MRNLRPAASPRPSPERRYLGEHNRKPKPFVWTPIPTASSRSYLHQVNTLARAKDDPLSGVDIPRHRPQSQRHIERIDIQGAPEGQFSELVLQRVTAGAE